MLLFAQGIYLGKKKKKTQCNNQILIEYRYYIAACIGEQIYRFPGTHLPPAASKASSLQALPTVGRRPGPMETFREHCDVVESSLGGLPPSTTCGGQT